MFPGAQEDVWMRTFSFRHWLGIMLDGRRRFLLEHSDKPRGTKSLWFFQVSKWPPFSRQNKQIVLKFEGEMAGIVVREFIGLKPKMRSIVC